MQVQKMIEQVTKAVEFVFLFTLLAGLAVLYAAIVSTQDERIHEAAIFRTLGARRNSWRARGPPSSRSSAVWPGFFAAAGASALGYALGEYALNLAYTFDPWLWLIGLFAGMAGVTAAGLMGALCTFDAAAHDTAKSLTGSLIIAFDICCFQLIAG